MGIVDWLKNLFGLSPAATTPSPTVTKARPPSTDAAPAPEARSGADALQRLAEVLNAAGLALARHDESSARDHLIDARILATLAAAGGNSPWDAQIANATRSLAQLAGNSIATADRAAALAKNVNRDLAGGRVRRAEHRIRQFIAEAGHLMPPSPSERATLDALASRVRAAKGRRTIEELDAPRVVTEAERAPQQRGAPPRASAKASPGARTRTRMSEATRAARSESTKPRLVSRCSCGRQKNPGMDTCLACAPHRDHNTK